MVNGVGIAGKEARAHRSDDGVRSDCGGRHAT